jgi:prepilin-type N-terminal cleavage/methylation domain-containing protein
MTLRLNKRVGFTLLELVLVMLIAAVLLAVVAPSLHGFGAGRQLDQAAAQLVAIGNWARDRAMQEGRVYRLNMDPVARSYWVTHQDNGGYIRPETDFGRLFLLPDGVGFTWSAPHQEAGVLYAQFFPTGRGESTTIELANRRGAVRRVGALSAAERFSLLRDTESIW